MTQIEKCTNASVGMIVKKDNKVLLIERKRFPFGFAPPAGHVDDGENYEDAAKRELNEEVGIDSDDIKLLIEGRKENKCRRPGGDWHYWKIYEAHYKNAKITIQKEEAKNAGWYTVDEIKKLAEKNEKYLAKEILDEKWKLSPGIEPVWYGWFKELNII